MGKTLVLGATGLVGAYTALGLQQSGFEVVACGRRKSDNGFFSQYGIPYYSVDITNKEDFLQLLGIDISSIVHLAGIMPAVMSGYKPHDYITVNLNGTLNVMEFAVSKNVGKIIFPQSRADSNYLMGTKSLIPADIEKKFPLKGDHSIYSICKNASVDLIEHFYHEYGIKRFFLRFPTIYGYHPNPYFYVNGERKMMAFRYIMELALKSKDIEIWGDPSMAKEIVYVKDTVQIIRRCLESQTDGGMFNVGRGVGVTLDEQIKGIVDVFSPNDKKSKIIYRPDMPNARQFIHDISKTKVILGYEPLYNYHNLLVDFKKQMETDPMMLLWGKRDDYE